MDRWKEGREERRKEGRKRLGKQTRSSDEPVGGWQINQVSQRLLGAGQEPLWQPPKGRPII